MITINILSKGVKMYKLFIGQYNEKHNPPLTFLMRSDNIVKDINSYLNIIYDGLDLYIEKPNKEVFAWYRDLEKHQPKDRWEILK